MCWLYFMQFQKTNVAWFADNNNGTALNGTQALADFKSYLQGLISDFTLAPYDHAVGLTR